MSRSNRERIFERIEKDDKGCWLYTGGISSTGYGIVSINNRSVHVHRVAYELRCGSIPENKCVLHRCDVRRCINPDHLFLGTKGENNTDRKQKGRNANRKGANNTQAKLTEKKVKRIFKLSAEGKSQRRIAEIVGICQQHVSTILRRLCWEGVSQ